MPRTLPEWIGKKPDSAVPPRVRVRIFDKFGGRCQCGCNRKIMAGEKWEAEDEVALINGGERREQNLRPFLVGHQKAKTAADVAEKSRVYRKRAKSIGVDLRPSRKKMQSRGFAQAEPQNSASRPLTRKSHAHI